MTDYKDVVKVVLIYLFITLLCNVLLLISALNAYYRQTAIMIESEKENTALIINHIEKHSVHPEYGNIRDVSYEGRCSPWDDCR